MQARIIGILRVWLVASYVFTGTIAHCQKGKKDSDFSFQKLISNTLYLPVPKMKYTVPLAFVRVTDVRYGQSAVGFDKGTSFQLGNETAKEIARYIGLSLVPTAHAALAADTAIVYIKDLWVGNELGLYEGSSYQGKTIKGTWKQGVVCKIECVYKRQGIYYPLFRFDTTLLTPANPYENAPALVAACLERVCQKLANTSCSFNPDGSKIDEAGLYARYSGKFNLPILTDSLLKKGLYKNFDEFKKDAPSCTNFEIRKERLADLAYTIDPAGTATVARDIWGYCDGTKTYIKCSDNFFALTRVGNSFYLNGFKEITAVVSKDNGFGGTQSQPVGFSTQEVKKGTKLEFADGLRAVTVIYKPYQVNMDTGDMY